ncbi:MAG: hypothetical protein K2P22_03700 [Lachnospiraceae bacterium]|nr:hypothetical protein [Lachnospiraceae bacterium]
MKKTYRSIDDVFRSPRAEFTVRTAKADPTDCVLRSTKLEDSIYADLRSGDDALTQTEQEAAKKLRSFPALSRDIYQSFYSLMPKRSEDSALSAQARKFNVPIPDHITQSEDFPTLKSVCEGRELPAYEAASEFIAQAANELDELLAGICGEKNSLNTLEKLEDAAAQAQKELAELLERMQRCRKPDVQLEQQVIAVANKAESKQRQVAAVGKMVDANTAKNQDTISAIVAQAVRAAAEKAEEVQNIIAAWGDDPGNLERNEVNTALLETVRKSSVLKDVAKYLGRFREIFAQGKRNGYAYGRGEKYSLELGSDLSRALTSELAMLASPLTAPMFLRKYQRRQIKQYRRQEPVYKGMGDIICCLDGSGSTKGDPAAWGKAVALTLLEIATDGKRKFALIHFSGSTRCQVDIFRPGEYTVEDKMRAAETFLDGGTNFQVPMMKAVQLIKEDGFENADIVFITDGECFLSEDYQEELRQEQAARRFTVTGVLLDKGTPSMDLSLRPFCQNIYRASQLLGDDIVRELVAKRV